MGNYTPITDRLIGTSTTVMLYDDNVTECSHDTGNGTQRAFNDDPSVLYVSLHRYEGGNFYPNGPFGSMTSCGEGAGAGLYVASVSLSL